MQIQEQRKPRDCQQYYTSLKNSCSATDLIFRNIMLETLMAHAQSTYQDAFVDTVPKYSWCVLRLLQIVPTPFNHYLCY